MEVSSWEMEKYLANPSLRSSVGSDWGHLTVRTRLEPASCRYLRIPATPDPWLVLTTGGGPRKTEVRSRNGWSCAFSGPGNLALTSPGKSTEIRWDRGDGSGIETIHVCNERVPFCANVQSDNGPNAPCLCDPPAYRASPGTPSNIPLVYAGHCATSGVRQQESFCRNVSQIDRFIASSVPKRNLE
jgi:hypothetical protein